MAAVVYRSFDGIPFTYADLVSTTSFKGALAGAIAGGLSVFFKNLDFYVPILTGMGMNYLRFPYDDLRAMEATKAQYNEHKHISWSIFSGTALLSILGSSFFNNPTHAQIGGALGVIVGSYAGARFAGGNRKVAFIGSVMGFVMPGVCKALVKSY